jgi:hypothetical protein
MAFNVFLRRNLMLAGVAIAAAPSATPQQSGGKLTALDVIDRVRNKVGIPWRAQTVDKIVAGAADTAVTGIATTMMATLEVLECAAGRRHVSIQDELYSRAPDGCLSFS